MIKAVFSPWLITGIATGLLACLTLWLAVQPEPRLLTWITGLSTVALLTRSAAPAHRSGHYPS